MNNEYQSPLVARYAGKEMSALFSPQFKYSTWRKLWIALAQGQQALGLPISKEQIAEMSAHVQDIPFESVQKYESELQNDILAHIQAFGDQCPLAKPIIHWGATSTFISDNTDIILAREAMQIIRHRLQILLRQLADFAKRYAHLPCLGFTHLQAAQLTTVGKRACLWLQDFYIDLEDLEHRLGNIKFLGVKGATGNQSSFLALFNQDAEKVHSLDHLIAAKMGFTQLFPISGQTYTRKQDAQIMSWLSGIGISAHKCATDIRLLAHMKEVEEPVTEKQASSSAIPYKRNPLLAERICSLARFLISLSENPTYTAAIQWLEHSNDDSANRRLSFPEAFLTCDAILEQLIKMTSGLQVNIKVIEKHIQDELPFLATEHILLNKIKQGGDRQTLFDKMRQHCTTAAEKIKVEDCPNPLMDIIVNDPSFELTPEELHKYMNINDFIGCAPEQVDEFLNNYIYPKLGRQTY
jgi:adenylosuccinate lyase